MREPIRTPEQEFAEDIFFGQIVIIWARWFLILAGTVLTLWTLDTAEELTVGVLPVLALMAMNFYLHGRHAMEKPANRTLIAIASGLDLIIISLIVLLWPGNRGFWSQYYIFYYPALLAFAFVFPQRMTIVYTLAAVILYTGACLWGNYLTSLTQLGLTPFFLAQPADQELFALRLVTMIATGALGAYYWRIQRNRRREAQSRPARA